eukprot:403376547
MKLKIDEQPIFTPQSQDSNLFPQIKDLSIKNSSQRDSLIEYNLKTGSKFYFINYNNKKNDNKSKAKDQQLDNVQNNYPELHTIRLQNDSCNTNTDIDSQNAKLQSNQDQRNRQLRAAYKSKNKVLFDKSHQQPQQIRNASQSVKNMNKSQNSINTLNNNRYKTHNESVVNSNISSHPQQNLKQDSIQEKSENSQVIYAVGSEFKKSYETQNVQNLLNQKQERSINEKYINQNSPKQSIFKKEGSVYDLSQLVSSLILSNKLNQRPQQVEHQAIKIRPHANTTARLVQMQNAPKQTSEELANHEAQILPVLQTESLQNQLSQNKPEKQSPSLAKDSLIDTINIIKNSQLPPTVPSPNQNQKYRANAHKLPKSTKNISSRRDVSENKTQKKQEELINQFQKLAIGKNEMLANDEQILNKKLQNSNEEFSEIVTSNIQSPSQSLQQYDSSLDKSQCKSNPFKQNSKTPKKISLNQNNTDAMNRTQNISSLSKNKKNLDQKLEKKQFNKTSSSLLLVNQQCIEPQNKQELQQTPLKQSLEIE